MIKKTSTLTELAKSASRIKINKALDNISDSPVFLEQIQRAKKILAVAGLPKLK